MTARIVLFGGGGFIGSALRHGLQGQLIAPTRSEVDLLDSTALRSFLEPDDVVINAAGYAQATDSTRAGLDRLQHDNVDAVRSLAEAGAARKIGQLIHLSSVAAMGHREGKDLVEDDVVKPRSPYGQSKRDAELTLADFVDDVPLTVLRPTSIFGEGRGLAALLCRVASLPLVPLPRGGSAYIPFSYVGNLVEAVRLSVGRSACIGRIFIVGDERSYRLVEVVRAISTGLTGHPRAIVPVPVAAVRAVSAIERGTRRLVGGSPILDPVRIDTLSCSVSYSIEAFQAATGYQPPFSLEAAAERIAAWHSGRVRR